MAAGQTKLNIVITAVDNATRTITRINKLMGQMVRPVQQLNRSFQQFSKASGLTAVASQLGRVGRAASVVARQISSAAGHMAQLVGLGSAAAIAAAAVEWGRLGFEVTRTANALGVAVPDLLGLRSVLVQSGMSAEGAAAALKSMGDTLEDATFGRNTQALVMMRQLGIELHRTSGGAVDSHRALLDLADALNDPRFKGNRQAQAFAARMFGVESLLPILLQGRSAILAQEAESRRTGSTRDATAANNFGAVLYRAQDAANGLRNTIGDKLIPVLQPLLEQFIQWEIANKDIIGTKIATFVSDLIPQVKALAESINKVVDALGGWKNVAIGVGVVMTASIIGPTVTLGKELLGLVGLIYVRLIPALLAMGAAGAASTNMIAGRLAMVSALGGLGAVAFGTGYGAGTLLDWWYSQRTGSTYGGDLYDADHPNADKAPADFNARFRRRRNLVERDPVTNEMAQQQEALAKANEAAATGAYRTVPGAAPPELQRLESKVEVHVHAPAGTTVTTKGPVSATVHHTLPSADLP